MFQKEVSVSKRLLVLIVSLFLLLSFPCLFFAEELTILHANDTHSHLYPFGPNDSYGGIDRMSFLIKDIKRRGGNVLTFHAGDVFVGSFAFNKYLGYPELRIMEGLYNAMALGNHEFDLGLGALAGILGGSLVGERPVTLPVLCANIDLPQGHPLRALIQPYIVLEVGGLKVGVIGVVNTDEYNCSPEVYAVLRDPFQAAGEAAYALRSAGCNLVICVSHLGKAYDVYGLSLVPGIDIIVGGHTHDALSEPIVAGGKIIVQAGEYGMYLGELKVNVENGGVSLVDYRLHTIDRRVRRDVSLIPTLMALRLAILRDPRFGPVYEKTIARALWNLEERWEQGNPNRDTALGNLVTDAIRYGVSRHGYTVDAALEANGYIATRIYKGRVVGNDILRSIPYGYDSESGLGFKIDVVLLAGVQILGGLEYTVSYVENTDELSMQASGLTFEYDSSKPVAPPGQLSRVNPASVKINGVPINPTGLYWIALSEQLVNFLKSMGLVPLQEIKTGLFEYNLVRDFMHKLRILFYRSEGRIIDTALLSSGTSSLSATNSEETESVFLFRTRRTSLKTELNR